MLASASDDTARRKGFGQLSFALEKYLGALEPPEGEVVQYYCGMAKDLIGSPTESWFQRTHDLGNPYGMERCGREEKTIRRLGP